MTILPYVLGATPNPDASGTPREAAPGFEVELTQAEAGEVLAAEMPLPEVGELAPSPVEPIGVPMPTPGVPPWPPGEAQASAAEEVALELPIGAEPKLDLETAEEPPVATQNMFPLAALFALDLIPSITTTLEAPITNPTATPLPTISPATSSSTLTAVEVPTLEFGSPPEELPASASAIASREQQTGVVISAERVGTGEELASTDVLDMLRLREVTVAASPPVATQPSVGEARLREDVRPTVSLSFTEPAVGQQKTSAPVDPLRPSAPSVTASANVTPPTPVDQTLRVEGLDDEPVTGTRPLGQAKLDPTPVRTEHPQPSRSTLAEPEAKPSTSEAPAAALGRGAVEIAEETDTLATSVKLDGQTPTPAVTSTPIAPPAETLSTTPTRVEGSDARPDVPMQQVIDQIETLAARRPGGSITIKLDPEDLGEITLTVRSFGQALTADLQATQPQTASTLEANKAQLVTQLESRGHQVTSVSVTTSSDSSLTQGQSQGQNGHAPLGRDDFQRAVNLREVAASSTSTPATRPFERPSQGVDVLI